MQKQTGDLTLAYLTLISGLVISVVAIWYSVIGLVSIFAAAAIPIIIMGVALEVSKLVATVWLKWNWNRAPGLIKVYLISAITILMVITSMGIFGFLSKAHLDQAVPLGDVSSQVALIDEKINNERETIANARTLLKQLDDAVVGIQTGEGRELRMKDGTTRIENPAERALQVRRAQARDRAALTETIEQSQKRIEQLQAEKAPIAGKLRAVEAEVGPIKYIAALIYGDNPDANLLEKAVRWVIIVIVIVFDPLAVVLLLSSQYSFQWLRKDPVTTEPPPVVEVPKKSRPKPKPKAVPVAEPESEIQVSQKVDTSNVDLISAELTQSDTSDRSWKLDTQITPVELTLPAEEPKPEVKTPDQIIYDETSEEVKRAMRRWKAENPKDSLDRQKKLFEMKLINELPWIKYIAATPDYVQNEEQGSDTIWQKLKASKDSDAK
jgi:hypothetical protein